MARNKKTLVHFTKADRNKVEKACRVQEDEAEAKGLNLPKSWDKMQAALARDDKRGQTKARLDKAYTKACRVREHRA